MILNGKDLSAKLKDELKGAIESYVRKPILAVIMIGDNEASRVYVNNKRKACEYVGISFLNFFYNDTNSEEEIIKKINELNSDESVNGIIVQLPIPDKFDTNKIINSIDPSKDVDGLTSFSLGKMVKNDSGFIPCTPKGIIKIFDYYKINLDGKNVTIVGRSDLVGRPMIFECLKRNATVSICHSKTKDLTLYTKNADVLIVAVGSKYLIDKSMIKEGSVLIDVGINRDKDGKLYGDINENAYNIAHAYTPVPGGVGPMTVVSLLENVFESYKKMNGAQDEESM